MNQTYLPERTMLEKEITVERTSKPGGESHSPALTDYELLMDLDLFHLLTEEEGPSCNAQCCNIRISNIKVFLRWHYFKSALFGVALNKVGLCIICNLLCGSNIFMFKLAV